VLRNLASSFKVTFLFNFWDLMWHHMLIRNELTCRPQTSAGTDGYRAVRLRKRPSLGAETVLRTSSSTRMINTVSRQILRAPPFSAAAQTAWTHTQNNPPAGERPSLSGGFPAERQSFAPLARDTRTRSRAAPSAAEANPGWKALDSLSTETRGEGKGEMGDTKDSRSTEI